jgi:hypothetical protein
VDDRFSAASSSLGPVWPEAMSSLAFSADFLYSATARTIAAVAMHQRMIAAITQPSQTWKASRKIASQIPKPIAPTRPTPIAVAPSIATRLMLSVVPEVSTERCGMVRIPDMRSAPSKVAAVNR